MIRLYTTRDRHGFAVTDAAALAHALAARLGLTASERCGGGMGVDDRDGERVEREARALAAEHGVTVRAECSRCAQGDCAWHGRRR